MIEEKKALVMVTKKKKFSVSSFLWDIFRAVIWAYFITHKVPTVHISNLLIQIPAETLLFEVSLIYLIYLILTHKGWGRCFAEFSNFYLAFLVFIPYLLFKLIYSFFYKIPDLFLPAVNLSKRVMVHIAIGMLFIFAIRNIFLFNNPTALWLSMLILIFCLIVSLISLCGWTSDPLNYYGQWGSVVGSIIEWFKRMNISNKFKDGNMQGGNINDIKKAVHTLWIENVLLTKAEELFINELLESGKAKIELVKQFVLILLFNVAYAISIFAFNYFAVYKIDNSSFKNVDGNFFDFFYFSVVTFTTLGDNEIVAKSMVVKWLIIMEVFTGIFLLTVTVLSFSSITKESAIDTCKKWKETIKAKKAAINSLLEKMGLTNLNLIEFKNPNDLDKFIEDKLDKNIKTSVVIEQKPKAKIEPLQLPARIFLSIFSMIYLVGAYDLIFTTKIWLLFKVLIGIFSTLPLIFCFFFLYRIILDIKTAFLKK